MSLEMADVWSAPLPRKVRKNSSPFIAYRVAMYAGFGMTLLMLLLSLKKEINRQPPEFSWFYVTMSIVNVLCWIWVFYKAAIDHFNFASTENRKLCESGVMIEGRFNGYRRNLNDGIWYSFHHPETGETVERLAIVYNKPAAAKLAVGDKVTVLYDPKKPKRSTVYEVCGYEVIGETKVTEKAS